MDIEAPEFKDLVSGSSSRIELWERVLVETNTKSMVEVGVWKGDFAKQVLERCEFIDTY